MKIDKEMLESFYEAGEQYMYKYMDLWFDCPPCEFTGISLVPGEEEVIEVELKGFAYTNGGYESIDTSFHSINSFIDAVEKPDSHFKELERIKNFNREKTEKEREEQDAEQEKALYLELKEKYEPKEEGV